MATVSQISSLGRSSQMVQRNALRKHRKVGLEAVLCSRSTVASQHWTYPWQVIHKWTTPRV